MNFLAPAAFFFALALPVVVVFYMLKRKRVVKLVSSTLLWQKFLADTQASAATTPSATSAREVVRFGRLPTMDQIRQLIQSRLSVTALSRCRTTPDIFHTFGATSAALPRNPQPPFPKLIRRKQASQAVREHEQ